MDDYITISAKTLDEAITEALLQLQTTSEHLYYEIIQKETSGVFGLFGGKPCIIRAKVMTEEEEQTAKAVAAEKERMLKEKEEKEAAAALPREETNPVKDIKPASEKESIKTKTTESGSAAESRAAEKSQKSMKKDREDTVFVKEDKPSEKEALTSGKESKPSEKESVTTGKESKPSGKENLKRKSSDRKQHMSVHEPEPVHEEKPRQPVKCDPEKVQLLAKEFLSSVLKAMGMEVEIFTSIDLDEGDLNVTMNGQNMGILIGKRGQTLDSLQYLTSLVVNKEAEGYLRVKLDTENYRERRKETLETLAKNIAYKVKRTKHPVSLEPMNPYERRIIHSALQGDKYVITRSEGEDPYRHVVISLKNEHYNGSRNNRYSSSKKGKGYDKRKESQPRDDEG